MSPFSLRPADHPQHQLLHGHAGRVTCLLYPHHVHSRYEIAHLVSGGVDFSVCLWDLYAGTLLHRFCVHAGEVTQLLVPPNNCTNRVLQSICTVASDHSVALVSLKERKCVMLASRHLFPIAVVKWRPFDDFMVVGCSDGSVYVWQMETGHLDRVLQGLSAEEVLSACDEHTGHPGERMTNPAVHLFRGLRHRNMAAIRHAAQRGLHHLQQQHHHPGGGGHHHGNHTTPGSAGGGQHQHGMGQEVGDSAHARARAHPLMIQGLRTNPVDQDSHVLFFDIEALIGRHSLRRRRAWPPVPPTPCFFSSLAAAAKQFAHVRQCPQCLLARVAVWLELGLTCFTLYTLLCISFSFVASLSH